MFTFRKGSRQAIKLNETYKVGAQNRLWMRSCPASGWNLSKTSVRSPLFLTQDFDYAYYYCSIHKSDDCILVVEVPDQDLCNLLDPNDYTSLAQKSGFPPEMADIFAKIEPYFSFNTAPSINLSKGRVPQEYLAASQFVIDWSKNNGLVPKKGQGNKLAAIVQSSSYMPCSAAAQAAELGKIETAYACAFDEVAKWVQRNPFLADKDNSSPTYVDVLQYAFFSMLHEQLGYNGFYCPEKSRESHAIASKDYKKSKYYFGHEDHTHPCIALFVPDNVSVLAVVPKEQLYIEIGNLINKDESMMQYSKRTELLSKAVDAWKKNSQSLFADRLYDDNHLSMARYYIKRTQDIYRDVNGFLPKEKRTRDQLA